MHNLRLFIAKEKECPYMKDIENFIKKERTDKIIYPPDEDIMACFDSIKDDLKVVIIGQDPYHNPNQANGLSFSVKREMKKLPPSLKNIYKELSTDIPEFVIPDHGDLTSWANQGVLLLNTSLTVEKNKPASHSDIGWEKFTDQVVDYINKNYEHIVFILWGKHAQTKGEKIDLTRHYVIESFHPSPFSARRGFFGSKPFSKTNEYLITHNKTPVNWQI